MDIFPLLIAVFAGSAAAIFAWLFFTNIANRVIDTKASAAESVSMQFTRMFVFIDAKRFVNIYLAFLLIVPILVWVLSDEPLLAVLSLVVLFVFPKLYLDFLLKRRLKAFEKQLPDALIMLANSLKVGASFATAVENLVEEAPEPINQEFGLYVKEIKLGVDFETALNHLEARVPLEDFSLCISAIRISREVGGNLAGTLESLADTLRRKLSMEGKIDSLTAQGKLQGIVMSSLPILLIVVLMRIEPAAMSKLFTTQMGWAVLAMVAAMQILGFLAIRKITTIDV